MQPARPTMAWESTEAASVGLTNHMPNALPLYNNNELVVAKIKHMPLMIRSSDIGGSKSIGQR